MRKLFKIIKLTTAAIASGGILAPTCSFINNNNKLNKQTKSSESGINVKVTFSAGTTGATLTGDTVATIKPGYKFFMVKNRPTATLAGHVFKGWALDSQPTSPIAENYKFTASTTLVPVFDNQPWVGSDKFFIQVNNEYRELDMSSVCDPYGNDIKYYDGSTWQSIAKALFNQEIWIGENVNAIPAFFLANCNAFNEQIHFMNIDNLSYISIGFMMNCNAFNKQLDFSQFNKLITIDDYFMAGCGAFNNGFDGIWTNKFVVPINLYKIGDGFLFANTSFNSPIFLNNTSVIGDYFMNNCTAYDKDIYVSPKTTHVGTSFMYNCSSMQHDYIIDVENPNQIFADWSTGKESHTVSCKDKECIAYTEGIKAAGTHAEEFKQAFPFNRTVEAYRRWYGEVIINGVAIENTSDNAANITLSNFGDNNPNIEYSTDGKNWEALSPSTPLELAGKTKLYLQGINENGFSKDTTNYSTIAITSVDSANPAEVTLNGNVMSLLDGNEETATEIPDNCFYALFKGSNAIKSIGENFFNPAITSYGANAFTAAFEQCSALTSVAWGSLTSIYDRMFWGCSSLASITLPETISSIGNYAFVASGITGELNLASVSSVGEMAFFGSSAVTNIVIPSTLTTVGSSAFGNMDALTVIDLSAFSTPPEWTSSTGEECYDAFIAPAAIGTIYVQSLEEESLQLFRAFMIKQGFLDEFVGEPAPWTFAIKS